ncbi:putative phosphoglycerate mutase [Lysinibacillus composti]|nr:histidine phosphatase family protein [Lysinibacillus composti]MBM7608835.1 putative phosphoglycerate mutase [Lysinibacillus composti]
MNKIEIFLIRHGETEWNAEGRLQGWLDSNLTPTGRLHAEKLRDFLAQETFHAVYSSPSQRALQTANILTNQKMNIIQDKRLQEIRLGNWQGRLIEEILQNDSKRYLHYTESPELYDPDPESERFEQVSKRMGEFLHNCVQKHDGERIVVVTHGVAIRALLVAIRQLPIQEIWNTGEIIGTSLTKLIVENGVVMPVFIGKTPHLENSH